MIIFECCPPFQPKPKLQRFGYAGWHFIWLWFGFHYVDVGFNEFIETAFSMGREDAVSIEPVPPVAHGDEAEQARDGDAPQSNL